MKLLPTWFLLFLSPSVLLRSCFGGRETMDIPSDVFPVFNTQPDNSGEIEVEESRAQKSGAGKLFLVFSGSIIGTAATMGIQQFLRSNSSNSTLINSPRKSSERDLETVAILKEKIEESEKYISVLSGDLRQRQKENEQLHGIISQLKQRLTQMVREKEEIKRDYTAELAASKNETKKMLEQQKQRLETLAAQEKEKIEKQAAAEVEALKNILQEIKLKEKEIIQEEVRKVQNDMASILEEERQELKQHMLETIAKLKASMNSNKPDQ
mmetsp:Transcript_41367/g.54383  ORF Transcript_41367/g.54383 Transcript_41367/m.54383 type:complete len:268 (+) Transcript_41367:42-845(+)